jgi:hypothetical protein
MEIRPVGAELFLADGQNATRVIVDFRNFVNAPERWGIPGLASLPKNDIAAVS